MKTKVFLAFTITFFFLNNGFSQQVELGKYTSEMDNLYEVGMDNYFGSENMEVNKKKAFNNFKSFMKLLTKNGFYPLYEDERISKIQMFIGYMYYYGEGTLTDKNLGFEWMEKSATRGRVQAEYYLGVFYLDEEKNILASKWIKKAYDDGFEDAKIYWDEYELWKYK